MNQKVDDYFAEGCGRCPLGGTPDCKVHNWLAAMTELRRILIECGLTETLKWSVPCYTFHGSNILIMAAFKEYCSISFFKGALLYDANKLLVKPGENTQAARLIPFTNVQQVIALEPILKSYIFEAIEVEKAGLQADFKEKTELVYVDELQSKLDKDPALKAAFEALTPGRQRGYKLYFSAPKQSKTREARVEKCVPQILNGKGLHDQ
ncbi:MAG: YdeI/OmpD-associated family protein [Lewinellaceae bacterium]|nr:YdeI/OmpD-associated family protein [Lewinellaceae bacterium]